MNPRIHHCTPRCASSFCQTAGRGTINDTLGGTPHGGGPDRGRYSGKWGERGDVVGSSNSRSRVPGVSGACVACFQRHLNSHIPPCKIRSQGVVGSMPHTCQMTLTVGSGFIPFQLHFFNHDSCHYTAPWGPAPPV